MIDNYYWIQDLLGAYRMVLMAGHLPFIITIPRGAFSLFIGGRNVVLKRHTRVLRKGP
jgi:hypothetical protein